MFIRKSCNYKDNAKRRICVYFKLKIQTKNMFPTKYFTNYVARMPLRLTKGFRYSN